MKLKKELLTRYQVASTLIEKRECHHKASYLKDPWIPQYKPHVNISTVKIQKPAKNQILSDKQKTADYYRWYKEAQLPISPRI